MNYQLISAILSKTWAIDPSIIQSYLPFIDGLMNRSFGNLEIDIKEIKPFAVSAVSNSVVKSTRYSSYNDAPEGSIAVISVNGPLMKSDQYCGPVGMATMGKKVQEADEHRNIGAIILNIDSPGGTVDGTEAFASIVKNTKKPVVAFVDGLMASAALWIGTSANEIVASTEHDEIGSIGVQLSFADIQPAWEKIGVVFHRITAPESKDKNKIFEDLRAGKYTEYENTILSPLAQKFISVVKENRPGVKDDQLTGKIFFAKDLVGTLIDSIGDFDYAVQRASELAAEYNQKKNNQTQANSKSKNTMSKSYKKVEQILDTQLESVDNSITLTEDQMETIENALPDPDAEIPEDLSEELQTANNAVTAYQEGIDAIDESVANAETPEAKIAALTAVVEALREEPGAESPKGKKENDAPPNPSGVKTVATKSKSFMENVDAVGEEYL